jgi:hypothetical protein
MKRKKGEEEEMDMEKRETKEIIRRKRRKARNKMNEIITYKRAV